MKLRSVAIVMAGITLMSCSENETTNESSIIESNAEEQIEQVAEEKFAPKQNFAVIWSWKTHDNKLVEKHLVEQAQQLNEFWREGKVENAYFDTDPKTDTAMHYPMISFFMKQVSRKDAESILDKMLFVKHGVAKYAMYPVGDNYYGRHENAAKNMVGKKTWVSVWGTTEKGEQIGQEHEALVLQQSKAVQKLYEKGIIENAYFNVEGTVHENGKADFVMFVNAETEQQAKEILEGLPFYQNELSKYQMYDVGVFWMGVNK